MNYTSEQIANIAKSYCTIKRSVDYISGFGTHISAIGIDSPSFEACLTKFKRIPQFKTEVPLEVLVLLGVDDLEKRCDLAIQFILPEAIEELKTKILESGVS